MSAGRCAKLVCPSQRPNLENLTSAPSRAPFVSGFGRFLGKQQGSVEVSSEAPAVSSESRGTAPNGATTCWLPAGKGLQAIVALSAVQAPHLEGRVAPQAPPPRRLRQRCSTGVRKAGSPGCRPTGAGVARSRRLDAFSNRRAPRRPRGMHRPVAACCVLVACVPCRGNSLMGAAARARAARMPASCPFASPLSVRVRVRGLCVQRVSVPARRCPSVLHLPYVCRTSLPRLNLRCLPPLWPGHRGHRATTRYGLTFALLKFYF